MPVGSRTFYKQCSLTITFLSCFKISSVQSLRRVQLVATPWNETCQACLSFTLSQSLLKLMAIESVMLSNHLVLCYSLFILLSIFSRIRVFFQQVSSSHQLANVLELQFCISPSNECLGLISFRIDWFISLLSKGLLIVFFSTTVQKHQFLGFQPSLWSTLTSILYFS